MSHKLLDVIPSQLLPQAASRQVAMRNIEERTVRTKAHYDKSASGPLKPFAPGKKVFLKPRPTNKSQPWIYGKVVEQPTSRCCVVKTAMGPNRRNIPKFGRRERSQLKDRSSGCTNFKLHPNTLNRSRRDNQLTLLTGFIKFLL